MAEPQDPGTDGARCLLPSPPLEQTKELAAKYSCDLAIPNNAGVGNVLVYTRMIDDLARKLEKRLTLLTAPICPPCGLAKGEDGFAIWRNNPYVEQIVNADDIDQAIMLAINRERDNLAHFGHMIDNIAYQYGIRPRSLRPSLYLTKEECAWAIDTLRHLERPLICLHPYSTSASPPGQPWHSDNWRELLLRLHGFASFFEVRLHGVEDKQLGLTSFPTTLRQMFALVWAADMTVGFDSAVTHVATAFERPAVVLWDPTLKVEIEERWQRGFSLAALSRWSYPQNDNVVLLGPQNDILNVITQRVRDRLLALGSPRGTIQKEV